MGIVQPESRFISCEGEGLRRGSPAIASDIYRIDALFCGRIKLVTRSLASRSNMRAKATHAPAVAEPCLEHRGRIARISSRPGHGAGAKGTSGYK